MGHYRYELRTATGDTSVGMLAAENAMVAAQQLRAQGHQLLNLTPVENHAKSFSHRLKLLNQSIGPSPRDILNFTSQLAVMIRAGISIRSALDGIADQTENLRFRGMLLRIKQDVEAGKQFSEALIKHPKHFNPLYINMVRASEMSGSFAKMLDRIAAYLAQWIETRAMVIGAMIYPCVIGVMSILVTMFLLTFVLPRFAMVFDGKEAAMPGPTRFLMNLSTFMVDWWWAVLIGMAGTVGGLLIFGRTDIGGLWFDRFKLSVPVFKKMFRALYISRSLQTLGELINAGVPMLDSLKITGDIAGNRLYRGLWRQVHHSVKQGKKITQPLQRVQLLPKSVVQMIGAGEESGRLGEVLDEVSSFYGKQLKQTIKTVTTMIEPVMIIVMGSIVGFIAMAIILPIFKLSAMVK